MPTQDLEDLLKTKTYFFADTQPLQESVDEIVADLRSTGKKMTVTNIFADNTTWLGKKVLVLDKMDKQKEVAIQFKPLASVYQLEVEYFDPAEVAAF